MCEILQGVLLVLQISPIVYQLTSTFHRNPRIRANRFELQISRNFAAVNLQISADIFCQNILKSFSTHLPKAHQQVHQEMNQSIILGDQPTRSHRQREVSTPGFHPPADRVVVVEEDVRPRPTVAHDRRESRRHAAVRDLRAFIKE